ncbi:MAG: UPF0182 family protein [Actinomycetota bacterium]|nr:UPF0182 family protein [Actinomycetota bacterium]
MINREPIPYASKGRFRRILWIVIGVGFVGLIVARSLATLWTDYLWYSSIGQVGVWTTLVFTRLWLVIAASLVAAAIFWLNLFIVDRLSPRRGVMPGSPDEELLMRYQTWVEPRSGRLRLAAAAFFGILIGLGAGAWWQNWLLFSKGGSFGLVDPIFDHDIGLYVFDVPFMRDVFGWTFQLILVLTLVIVAVHYLNGGISVQGPGKRASSGVKAHISILLAVLVLLKAVGYQLDKWDLLYSSRGQVFGASFTDVNAQVPALNLLILISIVAAVILLVNLWFRGWTLPLVAVGLWLVTSIVVGGVYPALVQRLSVQPDEVNKEAPYVAYNIEFTRQAFGLGDVEVAPFAASPDLSADDLAANDPTISNIRLWDPGVLKSTYQQLQNIVTYYDIGDVDVDRYEIDGELTQVMVSARELQETQIPAEGWVTERLVYTHGFGSVLSPANDVTVQGQPDFLVKDIPPVNLSEDEMLNIEQPRIYFSDHAETDYVIAGTSQQEVDFPIGSSGAEVATNSYDGIGGVEVGSFFNRAAWALRFGNLDTLISDRVSADSKVMLERNIRSRVERLAPFLYADADPYIVIADGELKWVMDLYTVTDRYPYSAPANTARLNAAPGLPGQFNYIRNSVKAVVDAYDGTVDLYIIDPDDPVIQANEAIFPGVFRSRDELPKEIIEHFRYPEDLFRIQTDVYQLYHMTDPEQFFTVSDPWQIARDPSTSPRPPLRGRFVDTDGQEFTPMLPYYLLMKLPGEEELSFLLMQPFTPRGRPNMVSFMVAKSGPLEEYGRIVEYELPSDSQIDGPGQVGNFVNQDPAISAEFTLLGQGGSRVIQGNMLVIPIEQSLLYVQPIYISANDGASSTGIPEFKRVVVSFNGQIEMRDSLSEALSAVFGVSNGAGDGDDGETTQPPTGTIEEQVIELLARADQAFQEAEAAMRNGDLVTWAQKIEEAQAAIEEASLLLSASNVEEAPAGETTTDA